MQAVSREVSSRQDRPHPQLAQLLHRRRQRSYMAPVHPRSEAIFGDLDQWLRAQCKPLILDAGCGTGTSSRYLADLYPDHAVIGIDKSLHRLERGNRQPAPPNCLLVRADLIDIWRLALKADWQPDHHYLLYPNPWPKPKHLARRWHAHPVLPWILALGGTLEMRTNWPLYADEFARAMRLALGRTVATVPLHVACPLTPFERKYRDSGHSLRACRLRIRPAERNYWSMATTRTANYNQLATTNLPCDNLSALPSKL